MTRRLVLAISAIIVIATAALAVYPFVGFTASGTSDFNVAFDKQRTSYQIYAPDADVRFSVWRNFGDSWVKLYPAVGAAAADTQYVAFAGIPFKISGGADADVICIDRTDATSVEVLAQ